MKDKKFLKEVAIILIVGIIINSLCFLMPLVVQAENISGSNTVPFYLDKVYSASGTYGNNTINTEDVNELYNAFFRSKQDFIISDLYTGLNLNSSDKILVTVSEIQPTSSRVILHLSVYVNPQILISINDNFVWSSNQVQINSARANCSYVYEDGVVTRRALNSLGSIQDYYLMGSANFFPGNQAWNYVQIYNYPLFANNLGNALYSSNGVPIIAYTSSLNVGEFTDLPNIDEILNNIQNTWEPPSTLTGHALPSAPTENPNNNDFQNRLQMFDYLKDSINSIVGNLGYNLKNWIDNLTGKLVEGFNSVSQNIWNGFKTLMDNIKDFFGPKIDAIIEKFEYITEVPDSAEIIDFIETTSVYSDISSINTSVSTFGTSFTGVSEPDDYTLTFHIEDIDILNQSQPFVLHLNILNPVKSTIRAMLWVIVSYGLFISVVDSLPNYINGGGGEDD